MGNKLPTIPCYIEPKPYDPNTLKNIAERTATPTPIPKYNPYDYPTSLPLFDNPLHKGKGSSSAGNSGDDNKQNDDNNPPILGYYYGDDDELYLYANSPYFDPVDNNDDNTDLLGFYPIINDEQPNTYPISYPVVSNPNYGNNQADEHYWWSYFVPGYGDYLSFKEAETGWDYTLATAGIVWKPARGAKLINRGSKAKKAADKAEDVAGAAGKLLPNGQSLSEFEKSLSRLPAGERVAEVKTVSKQVAQQNGWQKNNQLTTKNGGRDIYTDSKGNHYALDTQHGNWEMLNKQGKHQGVMNFDGSIKPNSKDLSGGHDIRVK